MPTNEYIGYRSNFHVHLTGAMQLNDIRRIGHQIKYPIEALEPLEDLLSFENSKFWRICKDLTYNEVGFRLVLFTLIAREAANKLRYIEITVNFFSMLKNGWRSDSLKTVLIEAHNYGDELGVSVQFKVGANRKDGVNALYALVDLFDKLQECGVVCIDLNGNELYWPNQMFAHDLQLIQKLGYPLSIHAGEFPQLQESLRIAIDIAPKRLAHCVSARCNGEIFTRLQDSNIEVEFSIISSLSRGAIKHPSEHPAIKLAAGGNKVLLGTDDPGLFANTIADEFELACKHSIGSNMRAALQSVQNQYLID